LVLKKGATYVPYMLSVSATSPIARMFITDAIFDILARQSCFRVRIFIEPFLLVVFHLRWRGVSQFV
jgi:hypothetical protein